MRGRRATKKELDDRPFNYPPGNKQGDKQAKLKKLWLGDQVVESDEGWCSGGTIRSSDLFPRDNSRVSEASLSSGVGEEEGVANQKKDVKNVTASNGFEPIVKLEPEGIRTPLNSWENFDKGTHGGGYQKDKVLEELRAESPRCLLSPPQLNPNSCSLPPPNPRCSLSPPPPNPNSPGEVSTYISYYLRRNLARGKKGTFLQSFLICQFLFLSREKSQISMEKG